jgi:hypothetical protein
MKTLVILLAVCLAVVVAKPQDSTSGSGQEGGGITFLLPESSFSKRPY